MKDIRLLELYDKLLKNADIAKALKDLFSLKIFIFHFLQKIII